MYCNNNNNIIKSSYKWTRKKGSETKGTNNNDTIAPIRISVTAPKKNILIEQQEQQ